MDGQVTVLVRVRVKGRVPTRNSYDWSANSQSRFLESPHTF